MSSISKSLQLFVLFCLTCVGANTHADQEVAIQNLLQSFGGGCSLQTNHTRRLIDASSALSAALRSIIQDEDCQGMATIAGSVHGSLDRISSIVPQYTDSEIAFQSMKEKKSALVSTIATETDPSERAILVSQLRQVEIDITSASKTAELANINEKNALLFDAANSYRSGINALLQKLSSKDACLKKHPNIAETIGTVGLALGQSATLGIATDGISVLAGAGIYTVTRIIQYGEDKRNETKIRQLSDSSLPIALSCTLEYLTESYCESDQFERLGKFVDSKKNSDFLRSEASAFAGINLLEKAIPSLDNSLSLIKIGSDPSSAGDALARSAITKARIDLQNTKGLLSGALNELRKEVRAIDPQAIDRRDQIFKAQQSFILEFIMMAGVQDDSDSSGRGMSMGTPNWALESVYKGQKARYYLMGFDPDRINFNAENFIRFEYLQIEGSYPPDAVVNPWKHYNFPDTHFEEDIEVFSNSVANRFSVWFTRAQSALEAKANLILKNDKKEILASFDEEISNDYSLTPIVVMQKLSQFVTNPAFQKYLKPKYQQIAKEASEIIEQKIIAPLNSLDFTLPDDVFEGPANTVFSDILKNTKYDTDTRYLINRLTIVIQKIVSEAAIELYKSGNEDMIYALSASDVVKNLKSFTGHAKIVDLINSCSAAKSMALRLVSSFVSAYSNPIERVLKEMNKPENLQRMKVNRGHLCLQLLGLVESFDKKFQQKVIYKNCEGATLEDNSNPPPPIVTRALWDRKTEDRICIHQNWRKKVLIYSKGID